MHFASARAALACGKKIKIHFVPTLAPGFQRVAAPPHRNAPSLSCPQQGHKGDQETFYTLALDCSCLILDRERCFPHLSLHHQPHPSAETANSIVPNGRIKTRWDVWSSPFIARP